MIKVNLINEFEFTFKEEKIVKKIVKTICKVEKVKGKHVVSIIIVDNQKIHEINKQYRNIDRPTDVISFAAIDGEETLPEEMGDIFISYEKIIEQAKEYEHSILREFAFLVTHGMYHLLGYDHMNQEDEKIMFAKQEKILDILKIGREK